MAANSGASLWHLPRILFALIAVLVSACAVVRSEPPIRIALLAPFEGRYAEIGYNALYAARLAVRDAGNLRFDLLAVDDGGTVDSAVDRAEALAQDPLVVAVVALGYDAASVEVQQALGDLPLLVVGYWSAQPAAGSVFILANPDIDTLITAPDEMPVTEVDNAEGLIGGEVFALAQVRELSPSISTMTVVSSASLPDGEFRERYRGSDPFAPEPGLLATLTYDAAAMLTGAVDPANPGRRDVLNALTATTYQGFNGTIRFENGYWASAPIHRYRYNDNLELVGEPE